MATKTSLRQSGLPLQRILNRVILGVIALSVLGQCLYLAKAWVGEAGGLAVGLAAVLGYIGVAVFPGMFLAFIKLLLNSLRSIKDERARAYVVVYLVISVWPILMQRLMPAGETAPLRTVEAASAPRRKEIPRSADYLAGEAWAKAVQPRRASECQGSLEFIKGCRVYFREHIGQPIPDGQSRDEGMTTAECQVEVNAEFEALQMEDVSHGNSRGAAVTRIKRWIPALRNCESYDNMFMPPANHRLQAAVDKLKAGGILEEAEKATIREDRERMSRVRDQPYKTAYFELADEYTERLAGRYKDAVVSYPDISCAEYRAKFDEMRNLDLERVAAMQALKRADGVVTNSARHNELNQQRIDMLWDLKYYTDGAKAAGCEIRRD